MVSVKTDTTDPELPLQLKHYRRLVPGSLLIAFLFLMAVFASGCVVNGRGHVRFPIVVKPHVAVIAPAPVVHVAPAPVHVAPVFVFSDHHRHTVRSYYDHHDSHGNRHKWKRKHGRGHGRGHGPPRWVRQGGHMPSGIHLQAVPHGLAEQLPPAPHGTQFIYYSDHVLLIDLHSHVVLDSISVSIGF